MASSNKCESVHMFHCWNKPFTQIFNICLGLKNDAHSREMSRREEL